MPIENYGVLKARVTSARRPRGWSLNPHYTIKLRADGVRWAAHINSRHRNPPHEILYWLDHDFSHPILKRLPELCDGWTAIRDYNRLLALDYVRAELFDPRAMRPLAHDLPGPNNDLSDFLDSCCAEAMRDPEARAYAFGSRYANRGRKGVHEMHMNQGSDEAHRHTDGIWQDGGLLIRFPKPNRWIALFLAFQNQMFETNDRTGCSLRSQ